MKSFAFERWDAGRLTVERGFAPLLEQHGLTTFDAIMNYRGGSVAKNLLRERTTTRIDLADDNGAIRSLFLKRHLWPPFREYWKPLLRLTRPILGGRHEWNAILEFHRLGIATMTPVALGESRGRSLLLTDAIVGCRKLTEWCDANCGSLHNGKLRQAREIIAAIAGVARKMHAAGLHHQDFYLTHLMVPASGDVNPLHVLDLGRVQKHARLARRWIVKDLAQLDYSAHLATRSDRLRFLRQYLDRPLNDRDRALMSRIARKSAAIARHSRKNAL